MDLMTILALISTIFIGHYLFFVVKKPKLICRNEKYRNFLEKNCPILMEKYWPTIWCYESHLMSLLSTIFRSIRAPLIKYQNETIKTPDGGILHLDHYYKNNDDDGDNDNNDNDKKIVLFLPGLTGSSSSEYITPLVKIASDIGYHSIVLNARGTNNNRLLTSRIYCCANDDDLRTCLNHLREKYPTNKIIAIGISFGGIILSRYLSMTGDKAKIDFAFVISVVWNFLPNNDNLERLINLPINKHLTDCLINIVKQNKHFFEKDPKINLERVFNSKTLRQFDDEFTSVQFGFKDAFDYYRESSNHERVHLIKKPTLCLNAKDDMFSIESTLPCDKIKYESDHVAMIITERGGHIGFMDGIWPISKSNGPYYLERLTEQYLRALYNNNMNKNLIY